MHMTPSRLKDDFYYGKQNIYEPHFIASIKDLRVRHVSSSQDSCHIVIVDEVGMAWSWGNNEFGQLGQGDKKHRRLPAPIAGTGPDGKTIVAVAASKKHTLLLTSKGEVLACGDNQEGQCGQGEMKSKTIGGKAKEEIEMNDVTEVLTPAAIIYDGPPIVKISCGIDFNLMLDVEGNAWTFGNQEFGKCGTGTDGAYNSTEAKVKMRYAGISRPFQLSRVYERDPKTKKTKPLQMKRIKSISAGSNHAAMVDEMSR